MANRRRNGGKLPRKKSHRKNALGVRQKQLSPHITSNERWVVSVPGAELESSVLLSEKRADEIANAIAFNLRVDVQVEKQIQDGNGNWSPE